MSLHTAQPLQVGLDELLDATMLYDLDRFLKRSLCRSMEIHIQSVANVAWPFIRRATLPVGSHHALMLYWERGPVRLDVSAAVCTIVNP